MQEIYSAHGIQFSYPKEWELQEKANGPDVTISVQSPNTAFWMLSLFRDRPEPRDVLETVLNTFEDEYEELDVYKVTAPLCHRPTLARDIDFVCHELLNCAFARVFRTAHQTVLVLYQVYDRELDEEGEILDAMTKSLECADPEWDAESLALSPELAAALGAGLEGFEDDDEDFYEDDDDEFDEDWEKLADEEFIADLTRDDIDEEPETDYPLKPRQHDHDHDCGHDHDHG